MLNAISEASLRRNLLMSIRNTAEIPREVTEVPNVHVLVTICRYADYVRFLRHK